MSEQCLSTIIRFRIAIVFSVQSAAVAVTMACDEAHDCIWELICVSGDISGCQVILVLAVVLDFATHS